MTSLLMVTSETITGANKDHRDNLRDLGYTVTTITQSEDPTSYLSDTDAILVMQTADIATGGTEATYRDADVPMLNFRRQSVAAFNLADSDTVASGDWTECVIYDDTVQMAAGYPAGSLTIYNSAIYPEVVQDPDIPATAVKSIHRSGSTSRWHVWTYEEGDTMAGTFVAPAKRAFWGLQTNQILEWNSACFDLFYAAVAWISGGLTVPDPPNVSAVISDGTVTLTWDASPTSGVTEYAIHRRSTQTGDPFDPTDSSTEITRTTDLTYDDTPAEGEYDYQVFGVIT